MLVLDGPAKLQRARESWTRFFEIARIVVVEQGGGIFRPDTGAEVKEDNGYIVWVEKLYDNHIDARSLLETMSVVVDILAEVWPRDTHEVQYIGIEYLKDENNLCVGVVKHFPNRYLGPDLLEVVAHKALTNNERAIWDCARNASVEVRDLCDASAIDSTICAGYERYYHNV